MKVHEVPVLLMGFNRADKASVVFDAIRKVGSQRLFIAVDGPRAAVPADLEKCAQVRALASEVDWPCEVRTLFQPANLGCRRGVAAAITWFFDQVEAGILLEDDVVPDPAFFEFCSQMLERYRNEERVAMVAGFNPWSGGRMKYSYAFSSYSHIWGWATWRRAWQKYDVDLVEYGQTRDLEFLSRVPTMSPRARAMWRAIFDDIIAGRTDTWDHQWFYTMLRNQTLAVLPEVNLVRNIGYGSEATHTKGVAPQWVTNSFPGSILGTLRHPDVIVVDKTLEARIARELFLLTPWNELKFRIKSCLGKIWLGIGSGVT